MLGVGSLSYCNDETINRLRTSAVDRESPWRICCSHSRQVDRFDLGDLGLVPGLIRPDMCTTCAFMPLMKLNHDKNR